MCWDGSTRLAPLSNLLTQRESKEKASAKPPSAPAVVAGKHRDLSMGDLHVCPAALGKRACTAHSKRGRKPKSPSRWVSATLF